MAALGTEHNHAVEALAEETVATGLLRRAARHPTIPSAGSPLAMTRRITTTRWQGARYRHAIASQSIVKAAGRALLIRVLLSLPELLLTP